VYGRITDPDAAALDLSDAAGTSFVIPLQTGGFFLANVPTDRWGELADRAGAGRILDASGKTLQAGCVDWGSGPAGARAGDRPGFWREGSSPCRPRPALAPPIVRLERAHKLFDVPLTADFSIWKAGTTIAFWSAPASNGETCVFAGPAAAPDPVLNRIGGDCRNESAPWPTSAGTFSTAFGAGRTHVDGAVGFRWYVRGRVEPTVERIELRSAAGATEAAFAGGYFFVQLPGVSPNVDRLPDGGPYTLVAYDAAGDEVARQSLDELQARFRGG
jgi:hypothetical protein